MLLVLDTSAHGLVPLAESNAYFDMDGDWFAEHTAWISPEDTLLATDINGNRRIDNVSELFGRRNEDGSGYHQLLENYDSNGDGYVTSEDSHWKNLLGWRDSDGDGFSASSELLTMNQLQIEAFRLKGYHRGKSVVSDSTGRSDIIFKGANGIGGIVYGHPFAFDQINSFYVKEYDPHIPGFFLPELRGYGNIPDSFIALSIEDRQDAGSLFRRLERLYFLELDKVFTGDDSLMREIEGLMYRWAGIDEVRLVNRGQFIDARMLTFMENFTGQEFAGRDGRNPNRQEAEAIKEAFSIVKQHIFARLIAQSAGAKLFNEEAEYSIFRDKLVNVTGFNHEEFKRFAQIAAALPGPQARENFWLATMQMIEYAVGIENLPEEDQRLLNDAIMQTSPDFLRP